MKNTLTILLLTLFFYTAVWATGPIAGSHSLCLGTNGYLHDTAAAGGTWTSSNPSVATIGLTTGIVYGVSAGTTNIIYTDGAGTATITYTVNPAPPPAITGASSFCAGTSSALSNSLPGGTWSSSNTYIATVDPVTGVVTGVHAGVVTIYYYGTGPCPATARDTILATSPGSIAGPNTVCAGSSISVADTSALWGGSSSPGTWSSSDPSVATIGSATSTTGTVTGVSAGTVTITYTTTGTCGTAYTTKTITVSGTTTLATISGAASVTAGASTALSASVAGGTWSSGSTSVATINAATGIVTGVAAGSVVITYNQTGCGGPASATYPMTVTALNGISGHVNFTGAAYNSQIKVWLITYNPSTMYLAAIDSTVATVSSGTAYYQFTMPATDSYRVKAAMTDTMTSPIGGYTPTYHPNSFYWYSATAFYHTAGTADINKDINMVSGATGTGPGFVEGYVYAGANRGTTGGTPVAGLSMNILNTTTNQMVKQIRTNALGHYSFSSLPVGNYYVFPDSLNYLTTAYTNINITTTAHSASSINFNQNTLSKTITPQPAGLTTINNTPLMLISPTPTTGKLDVQWSNNAESATLVVSDIAGNAVYKTVIMMHPGSGTKQIDLSTLANGIYIVSVRSATMNYSTKIQVQH